MATTLATLVITIIASSSMKLAKVNCPIESENDRIRRTISPKAMGLRTRSEQPDSIRWNQQELKHQQRAT
jgi:hypothetical protein